MQPLTDYICQSCDLPNLFPLLANGLAILVFAVGACGSHRGSDRSGEAAPRLSCRRPGRRCSHRLDEDALSRQLDAYSRRNPHQLFPSGHSWGGWGLVEILPSGSRELLDLPVTPETSWSSPGLPSHSAGLRNPKLLHSGTAQRASPMLASSQIPGAMRTCRRWRRTHPLDKTGPGQWHFGAGL